MLSDASRLSWSVRRPIAIVLVLALVGLTAGSVTAAPATVERSVGRYAAAETGDCREEDGTTICLMEHIEVAQEGRTTQVCVYIATTVHPPDAAPTATIEFGCTTTSREAFAMDPQLNSAILQRTTVSTVIEVCDNEGQCTATPDSATVSGVWTGIGVAERFRDQNVSQTNRCTTVFVGGGQRREATATLTIDGATIGASFGGLVTARSLLVVTSSCTR